MNRLENIKHKGKRIDNGEWVHGFYANGLIGFDEDKDIYRHFIIVWDINGYFTDYIVDPDTVCLNDDVLQRLEIAQNEIGKIYQLANGLNANDMIIREKAAYVLDQLKEP